jgi:hypothetical protein
VLLEVELPCEVPQRRFVFPFPDVKSRTSGRASRISESTRTIVRKPDRSTRTP